MRYAMEVTSIELELDWLLDDHFKTGLRETARWTVKHSTWWGRIRSGVLGGKRLGAQS